jgi:Uma2 family endonuclease
MAQPILRGPFTVDAYQRLAELGVLRADARVELLDGQVVEMSPIGDRHANVVRRLNRLLSTALLDRAIVDIQNPVVLGSHDAPQPDLVLLRPRADAYPNHPRARDILLIVEIADTTLAYDRDVKVPLYARSGIPETWLIDLSGDQIFVCRRPAHGAYAEHHTVSRDEKLALLAFPSVTLAAADVLG